MCPTGPQEHPAGDGRQLWSSHPDALILVDDSTITEVNPTTERLFGHPADWLQGRAATLLVPSWHLRPHSPGQPLFRARHRAGHVFPAMADAVPLGSGSRLLVTVRDLSPLVDWLGNGGRLEERAQVIESSKETLIQYLFGTGMAIRACLGSEGELPRERLEEMLDTLQRLMDDLTAS
ncbi:MAG: PAS domain S-box protein [Acidimicrobiales bacterium]